MTKRHSYRVAALLAAGALALAGCGSGGQSGSSAQGSDNSGGGSTANVKGDITLGAGVTGGSYYVLGGALGTLLHQKLPDLNVSVLAGSNDGFIQQGTDCMMEQADTTAIAYSGAGGGAFKKGQAFPDLRLTAVGYDNSAFLLAPGDTHLKSSADLGPDVTLGVTTPQYQELVKELLGGDQAKLPKFRVISGFDALTSALIQGNVDAVLVVGAHPLPDVLKASNVSKFTVVPWQKDELNQFIEKFPYYPRTTIKAGTYNFIKKDLNTWSRILVLDCQASVPDDVVYAMTKVIYENNGPLTAALPQAKAINLDVLQETLKAKAIQFPVHPGAARYFKEKGVTIPDSVPQG